MVNLVVARCAIGRDYRADKRRARRLPPLHAEGDLRAAARWSPTRSKAASARRAHSPNVLRRRCPTRCCGKRAPRAHRGVRYELPRRPGRPATGSRQFARTAGASVELASEYRYRDAGGAAEDALVPGHLAVGRNGRHARRAAPRRSATARASAVALCNVPDRAWCANPTCVLMTHAGPEIGVASTKAFTTPAVPCWRCSRWLGRIAVAWKTAASTRLVERARRHLLEAPSRATLALDHDRGDRRWRI